MAEAASPNPLGNLFPPTNVTYPALIATPEPANAPTRIGLSDMNTQKFAMLGSFFIVGLDTAMFPLNTLQTIMMSERSVKGRKSIGVLKLTSYIFKSEGIGRFWKGAGTAVFGSFPGQATYYMTYESIQDMCGKFESSKEARISDVAAGLFYVPTDIISQRLQTQNAGPLSFSQNSRLYKGPFDVFQKIWRHEGIAGFWRGYLGYVASFAPASAVQWGTYELAKTYMIPAFRRFHSSFASSTTPGSTMVVDRTATAMSGGMAGIAAVVVNNPLEVMRVRHQLLECRSPADAETIRRGYLRLGLSILRQEGVGESDSLYYCSVLSRIESAFIDDRPTVVLAMTGYETIKEISNNS
ncbi:mitochondrial carrier domain-containing protein [Chytridium lagenaria]|nr:mitochondrial carrier domain-containing protein [Chytridium lagenaria]